MKIIQIGIAGTVESSDAMITVEPNSSNGNHIDLSSSVEKQFGKSILALINTVLEKSDVNNAYVKVVDKGALDYVLTARLKAALYRAADLQYNWED